MVYRLFLLTNPDLRISIILSKKQLLYAKEEVKNIFTPPPFVSFCAGFSLRNCLVRAKVSPLLRECGSSSCNKSRCLLSLNVSIADFFQRFVTKKSYKKIIKLIARVNVLSTCSLAKQVDYSI